MTLAEYFETPETLLPQELIFGAVRVADAPFVPHQRLVLRLAVSRRSGCITRRKAGCTS